MNSRLIALIAVVLLLGGFWYFKSGKTLLSHPKQDAMLMCANPECNNEFTMVLPLPFDKYPVVCPKCGQKTAYPVTSCGICGAHYPMNIEHPLEKCPKCGVLLHN
jgi:DNA-directed RNA polymerase subunit RPC12/RpoP